MVTPVSSLLGGGLIGAAASIPLLAHGRIAGISGIVGGVLHRRGDDLEWRLLFLAGLVGGGAVAAILAPGAFPSSSAASAPLLTGAGLLVGVGTRLGGGCTSGHGVCGLGRLSFRSLVATLTFLATGAVSVLVLRQLAAGAR